MPHQSQSELRSDAQGGALCHSELLVAVAAGTALELAAQACQGLGLPRLGEMPGRVVRMNQHNRTRLGRDGAPESLGIDLPAMVIEQLRCLEGNIIQLR